MKTHGHYKQPSSLDTKKLKERELRFSKKNTTKHYGLVSRGEDVSLRLNKHNEREELFNKIKQDFIEFCANAEDSDFSDIGNTKLEQILLNLRKLREALLNSAANEFTVKVYLYSIKVASRIGHYQTYVPCVNFLIHNKHLINEIELNEIVTIYILHLSHFNNGKNGELNHCFQLFFQYIPENHSVKKLLRSLVDNNYIAWFELYCTEFASNPSYKAILYKNGMDLMVKNMINVINATYFQLSTEYLEKTLLRNELKVDTIISRYPGAENWKLNGTSLIIRERKK